jgi:hypothetical protein
MGRSGALLLIQTEMSGDLLWPAAAHARALALLPSGRGCSNAATSDRTLIKVRAPTFMVEMRFCLINSYNVVRPSPVATHASATVQLIRSRKGTSFLQTSRTSSSA